MLIMMLQQLHQVKLCIKLLQQLCINNYTWTCTVSKTSISSSQDKTNSNENVEEEEEEDDEEARSYYYDKDCKLPPIINQSKGDR